MSDNTAQFNFYLNRQGVTGKQGAKGEKGFSPVISVEKDTLSEYILRITNESSYFLTTNLRESKEDRGGTYIRYDRDQGIMYAGDADRANKTQYGEVKFATPEELAAGDENTVITPADLEDATTNMVTTNTDQTITGNKSFSAPIKTNTIRATDGTSLLGLSGGKVSLGTPANASSPLVSNVNVKGHSINIAGKNFTFTDLLNSPNITYTVLHSGNLKNYIQAGENITIDKTSTGITINSTGGGEVPDNVAILTENQTFTGHNYFNGQVNFNGTVQFTNQQVNIPKLYSSNTITGSNITLDSAGKSYKFPCQQGTLSLSATSGDEAGTKAGLYINGAGIDNKRLLTEDDLSSGDAYTKAETGNLLDAKQNKLVAGTGITISDNNEIYLDRTSYINNSINYVNKDISYGEIKNNIFYQLQNNTFDNPVDGFKSLGFNTPSEQINSFDFIVCVKLVSPYEDNPGNIMRIGLGDTEVSVDTLYGSTSGGKLRFNTKISGTGKAFLNTDITDTQYTLLRLKHIGTDNTLRIYSLLSDVAKLPEEDEWTSVGTVDWNISQYQPTTESGDLHLQELFSIGGVNITNLGEDKTYGMQSGNYYLAFTRLIVNENIIFNGSAISNPAEATKDEYGLVKIDFSTITTNSNGQLQANIPTDVTRQGNNFNGANQLVQLDKNSKLPAIDGSQLTNLPSTTPTNMVTTDTAQTITGQKIFKNSFVSSDSTATTGNRVLINNARIDLINDVGVAATIDNETINLRGGINSGGFTLSAAPSSGVSVFGQKAKEIRMYGTYVHYADNDVAIGTILDTGNFATLAPTGALKYWTGTEANYTGLATKDADTLYRTTDTNKVFLGTIQLGGNT